MGKRTKKEKQAARNKPPKEIAYQNKDITSKVLAERFKGKTFRAYGLALPRIRNAGPTNIPVVRARELRLDNLFELEDDTVAIVDYESEYDEKDKVKYLNYLAGIASRYQQEKKKCPALRMVVIYTGDVCRREVPAVYDLGAVKISIEPAFLSELDGEGICRRLGEKVNTGQKLTDEELMEFIILPLSYRTKEGKAGKIQEMVDLAQKMQDREQQVFVLAGLLAFTDKVIDEKTAERIRRMISMIKVERMIWEEAYQEYLQEHEEREKERKEYEKEREKERKEYEKERKEYEKERKEYEERQRRIVYRMIEKGEPTAYILEIIPECTYDMVEAMRRELEEKGTAVFV